MKNLETKRLIFREWHESDFEEVHAYASVMENVRFMPFGPNSEDETKMFLKRSIEKYSDKLNDFVFAITTKSTREVIGGCQITKDDENQAFMGWILHRGSWKQGFGTELAGELIRFGFDELKLHRIYATCDSENYGSYRIMERNNMRREAHFIKKNLRRGEWRDELVYAILDDEWSAD